MGPYVAGSKRHYGEDSSVNGNGSNSGDGSISGHAELDMNGHDGSGSSCSKRNKLARDNRE